MTHPPSAIAQNALSNVIGGLSAILFLLAPFLIFSYFIALIGFCKIKYLNENEPSKRFRYILFIIYLGLMGNVVNFSLAIDPEYSTAFEMIVGPLIGIFLTLITIKLLSPAFFIGLVSLSRRSGRGKERLERMFKFLKTNRAFHYSTGFGLSTLLIYYLLDPNLFVIENSPWLEAYSPSAVVPLGIGIISGVVSKDSVINSLAATILSVSICGLAYYFATMVQTFGELTAIVVAINNSFFLFFFLLALISATTTSIVVTLIIYFLTRYVPILLSQNK